MITEGWDARTVTHMVGFRAFGSQLLCEQVGGRTLRRRIYEIDDDTRRFDPEYSTVVGVPWSYVPPSEGAGPADPKDSAKTYNVALVPGREERPCALAECGGIRRIRRRRGTDGRRGGLG